MNIKNRKPRRTRFEADDHGARLARLKEQAPTLAGSRRLTFYAILGSVMMVLTVGAFYFSMEIYQAAAYPQEENIAQIEVAPAGEVTLSERQQLLQRMAELEAAEETELQAQMEALRQVDLWELLPAEEASEELGQNQ